MKRAVRRWFGLSWAIVIALGAFASPALAQDDAHDATRLFARRADVSVPVSYGTVRLPITPDVLAEAQPTFSDLRLFDPEGVERPYLVDGGARRQARSETYSVLPSEVTRRIEEDDTVAFQFRERFVIAPPAPPPTSGEATTRWTLITTSDRPTFVRQVVVTTGDDPPVELARGTVFRFQHPTRERTTLTLPPLPVDELGVTRPIVVEVQGEEGYIEPTFQMRTSAPGAEGRSLVLPLTVVETEERENGTTVIYVERPTGIVPTRLRLETSDRAFARRVRVFDQAPGYGEETLGDELVYRAAELEGAELLEVPLRRANEQQLRIEIDNADSPPLSELRLSAVIDQPSILFEAIGQPLVMMFGGNRSRTPRYDLAPLHMLGYGEDVADLPEATLGAITDNPRFDDGPALAFAMDPGRVIDRTRFTHATPITIEGAEDGLSILRLSPEVLATTHPDLADVRVVDEDGRQRPYLVRHSDEDAELEVSVGAPTGDGDPSIYDITLPVSVLPVNSLAVVIDESYASRDYRLRGMSEYGRWVSLDEGSLHCDPQEPTRCRHVAQFAEQRVTALQLRVEDGDDAPLTISSASVRYTERLFYVAAEDGEYALFTGDMEADPPEYEIRDAERLVLAVRPVDAQLGDPVANPDHVAPAWYEETEVGTWLLWGVLILAVLLLGALTVRLSRERPQAAAPTAADGEGEDEADDEGDEEADDEDDGDGEPEGDDDGEAEETEPTEF